jgi:hypothetical protein
MKKKKEVKPLVIDVKKDVANPQSYPWPYKDNSVSELTCADVLEFVPGKNRPRFMDEIYRILVPDGKAAFVVRYWNTQSAVQDYMYEWPPLTEQSFLYFNKGWREANGLKRSLACDFDFTYGYSVDPDTASRNDETRAFNVKNYCNAVSALQLVLTKREK